MKVLVALQPWAEHPEPRRWVDHPELRQWAEPLEARRWADLAQDAPQTTEPPPDRLEPAEPPEPPPANSQRVRQGGPEPPPRFLVNGF